MEALKHYQTLYEHTDYRQFLKTYYNETKSKRAGWGLKAWANRLGLKSKSALAMIMNGQRHPSRELTSSFVRYFKFNSEQAEYFADLIEWQKTKGDGQLSLVLGERLAKKRQSGTFAFIDIEQFRLLSEWHFAALREISKLGDFRNDPFWISHQLYNRVTPSEVKRCRRILSKLDLRQDNATTSADVASEAIRRFHSQMMELARISLNTIPLEEREYFSSTFAVKQADLPRAKRLLRKLANEFADNLEKKDADRVYQLQVCFFPLTRLRTTP